jgi:hypothetical protein
MTALRPSEALGAAVLACWLPLACGTDRQQPSPLADDGGRAGIIHPHGGGTSSDGGDDAAAGVANAPEGGAAGDASSSAGAENAAGFPALQGGAGAAGATDPPPPSPMFSCPSEAAGGRPTFESECSTDLTLGQAERVAVDAGNYAHLIAVTPDELSIAWSSLGSSQVRFFVADRWSANDGFDPPRAVATTGSVVALSADGLSAITLDAAHVAYSESVRDDRGQDFGEPTAGAFAPINAQAQQLGLTLGAAVLSADSRSFFYVAQSQDASHPVRIATRNDDGPFPVGEPIDVCELEAHGALVRTPTGISNDGLTLFFFDPDRNALRAAWRSELSAPFSWFTDVGRYGAGVPTADCSAIYYSASGDGPLFRAASR